MRRRDLFGDGDKDRREFQRERDHSKGKREVSELDFNLRSSFMSYSEMETKMEEDFNLRFGLRLTQVSRRQAHVQEKLRFQKTCQSFN
uniref:Uncharacterized protein n=1 Tax=Noccaea caerulescens TaxID=107243 RepID=A0A1J3J790_NOCCA